RLTALIPSGIETISNAPALAAIPAIAARNMAASSSGRSRRSVVNFSQSLSEFPTSGVFRQLATHGGPLSTGKPVIMLACEREQHVVAPFAVDLQVMLGQPYFPEPVRYEHAARRGVVGQAGRLDPVQAQ